MAAAAGGLAPSSFPLRHGIDFMKSLVALLALILAVPVFAQSKPPNVLIISIDGLRPDMALRAKTPNLHQMLEVGCFSFWARTTPLAITLPSHTSMLTGVIPRKHEIEWNKDLPLSTPVYPNFPTIFEVAKKHGFTTAMAAGKSKFSTLAKPGTLDWSWIAAASTSGDIDVAEHAIEIIRQHQPQVMFIHFPGCDNVGHAKGWGTPQQLEAIAGADAQVGRVFAAMEEAKVKDNTFIILTADHGGAGRTHVPDDARSRHIPWIAVGPHVRKNIDLTTYADLIINTEDTFATACYVLKLPLGKLLDGKPIKEIFEVGELIEDK
jgi:predicted AlkP superfamily pyrophosphatase or phosphodiesterase